MSNSARCFIVSAGDFFGEIKKGENDLIIAADGGLEHLKKYMLRPDIIIGDFDSLGYIPEGENVIRLPVMKDETDTFAAVRIAIEKGFKEIILLGCTGGKRSDHFIANLQTLVYAAEKNVNAFVSGNNEFFTAVKNSVIEFHKKDGGYISVFSSGETATVSIKGLLYETDKAVITNSSVLGASNEFNGKESLIKAEDGSVIICWQGGLSDIKTLAYEV